MLGPGCRVLAEVGRGIDGAVRRDVLLGHGKALAHGQNLRGLRALAPWGVFNSPNAGGHGSPWVGWYT